MTHQLIQGPYPFIEGIETPINQLEAWALNQANYYHTLYQKHKNHDQPEKARFAFGNFQKMKDLAKLAGLVYCYGVKGGPRS